MELSIDLLKTFVTISRLNSFTKAAAAMNITQSAVSMQMKRLEEQTGRLFVKQGRGFIISPLGEKLLEHAVRIIRAHDDALSVLSNPAVHDHIRIGSPELYASAVFPRALKSFYTKYPNSRIDFTTNRREKLLRMVESGELDIALCSDMPDEYEKIFSEPVKWIRSADSSVHELRPLPLAVYPEGCHVRRWSCAALERSGTDYRISFVTSSVFGLMAAVRAGIAVAPMGMTKFMDEKDSFRIIDELPEIPDNTLSIVTAEGFQSRSADTLVQFIREELGMQMMMIKSGGRK